VGQETSRYELLIEARLSISLCDRVFRPDQKHSLLSQRTPHKHKSDYLPGFKENYEIMTLSFPLTTCFIGNDNNLLKPTGYLIHQQV